MAHDVFISYEKHDLPVAEAICRKLEANGVSVWYAPRDILPGANWVVSVLRAIELCRVVVFIYSKSTDASEFIPDEINQAKTSRRPIIPFCLAPFSETSSLKFLLSTAHWLDAYRPPLEPHYEKLVETVRSHLKAKPYAHRTGYREATTPDIASPPLLDTQAVAAAQADTAFHPGRLIHAAAIVAAIAALAGGVSLFLTSRDVAAPQAPSASEVSPQAVECASRLAQERAASSAYTSLKTSTNVTGRAEVLCLDVLSVGAPPKVIQLAGVGARLVPAERRLANWINSYGGTMVCQPVGYKYRCHVGGAGDGDVSDYILRNNWALRAAD